MVSKLVHGASWLAVVLALAATAYWILLISDGHVYCWDAFVFTVGMALPLGAGILFLGVIPSAALYVRTRQTRDWQCLLLTGGAFAILVIETFVINFIIRQTGE